MGGDETQIGKRVREIRSWRRMSAAALADLAGISRPYLSLIERGQRPVTKRSLLEALAGGLRVSPEELTGKPYPPTDAASNEVHAGMVGIEDALTSWWLDEVPDAPLRPWPQLRAELDQLVSTDHPAADLAAEAARLPGLIRDLLVAAADQGHRHDALVGLMEAYHSAYAVASNLGCLGLPALAVERMHRLTDELDDPMWRGFVAWVRSNVGVNRARQYELAVHAADAFGHTRPEIRGMANLTAAQVAAERNDDDTAQAHLAEATAIATRMDADTSPWMQTQFGRTNVEFWRVAIDVELGHRARVAEVAARARPQTVTVRRQAWFWADVGRGLIAERRTRERGIAALIQAERLAPQLIRNNPYVREAVADLLISGRREADGRELRGLAWRLGLTPAGRP